jgi:hypothetical protein
VRFAGCDDYRPIVAWSSERVNGLLAGPWGRRLCIEVLGDPTLGATSTWSLARATPAPDNVADEVARIIASSDLQTVAASTDPLAFLAPLSATVYAAAYWQPLDDLGLALAEDGVGEVLLPVAEAIGEAPATQWWHSPIPLGDHHRVLFDGLPAFETDSATALRLWRAGTLDDEHRAADRPADPAAPWGGRWWSTPALVGLTRSTRSLPGGGPVGLALVVDAMGWTSATVEHLARPPDERVYEIDGPADWTTLVARYPLTVTNSRRHDWWKITRRAGDWLLPDYEAMALDFGAVHLSVSGYLSSAGRAPRGRRRRFGARRLGPRRHLVAHRRLHDRGCHQLFKRRSRRAARLAPPSELSGRRLGEQGTPPATWTTRLLGRARQVIPGSRAATPVLHNAGMRNARVWQTYGTTTACATPAVSQRRGRGGIVRRRAGKRQERTNSSRGPMSCPSAALRAQM